MMKLFYTPGASSFAVHMLLRELGLDFVLKRVDLSDHRTEDGRALREINPKLQVPVLELDTHLRLTEVAVILQYLCDTSVRDDLMPRSGTFARYRALEAMNLIATEFHKGFAPLRWSTDQAVRDIARLRLASRFAMIEDTLRCRPFLLGSHFSAVDPYLLVMISWADAFGIDLSPAPAIHAYALRLVERVSVKACEMAGDPMVVSDAFDMPT